MRGSERLDRRSKGPTVLDGLLRYLVAVLLGGLAIATALIAPVQASRVESEQAESQRLNREAERLAAAGKLAEAVALVQRALAIGENPLGPEHAEVATSLHTLARLYGAQGKYAEAEPLQRRALAIREKALGPEHPAVAASLHNLAVLYAAQGKYAKAEPMFRRALAIGEQTLGPGHPNVAIILDSLAALLRETERKAEAERMQSRATLIRAMHSQANPKE